MAEPESRGHLKTSSSIASQPSSKKSISISGSLAQMLQKYTGPIKTSSSALFLVGALTFAAYCIARLPSLNYDTVWGKEIGPGEWYWFRQGRYRTGMIIHLWSVLPAGALMPLQFLPIIRRRYTTFHRLNGRLLLILLMMGTVSALMIADRAFGGTISTQVAVVNLAIITTVSTVKGYIAIRNLHIDQHRSWMLRTWSYASSILTIRVCLILIVIAATFSPRSYHTVFTCQELLFMYDRHSLLAEDVLARYPLCRNFSESVPAYVVVNADTTTGRIEEFTGMMKLSFGPCVWLGMIIHIFAVEWYLRATKDEDERLRKVSLARRKAAGLDDLKSISEQ